MSGPGGAESEMFGKWYGELTRHRAVNAIYLHGDVDAFPSPNYVLVHTFRLAGVMHVSLRPHPLDPKALEYRLGNGVSYDVGAKMYLVMVM